VLDTQARERSSGERPAGGVRGAAIAQGQLDVWRTVVESSTGRWGA
jgi:hypothetical protein